MRRRVAGLRDDAPGAGAKGAEGAERDRLVVQVEVLRPYARCHICVIFMCDGPKGLGGF